MSKLTIGEFLAYIRKEKGMTQREVAEILGISNRTLSAWEQGRAYPDILTLSQLAEIYGVTADEILKGERRAPAEANLPAIEENAEIDSSGDNTGSAAENYSTCGEEQSEFTEKACRAAADKFSVRSKIFAAVHCCGALILSLGFVSGFYIVWLGILLIVVGVCAVVVSCGMLAAFSDGALKAIGVRARTENTEYTAYRNRYALSVGKSNASALILCGAVWCAFAFVIAVVWHGALVFIISLLPLCFGLLMIIFAAIGSSHDIKRYGNDAQRAVSRANGGLLKKCVAFAAVPVAVAVGVAIFFSLWRQTERFVDYKGERGGMVAYMQTAVLSDDNYSGNRPAGEYALDFSEVTTVGEFVRVHEYFYAVLREDGDMDLFTAEEKASAPSVEAVAPVYYSKIYTVYVPDGGGRVYDVRYGCKAVEYSNVESSVEISFEDGEYAVTRTEITDYSFEGRVICAGIIMCSAAVCIPIYVAKRKRLPSA